LVGALAIARISTLLALDALFSDCGRWDRAEPWARGARAQVAWIQFVNTFEVSRKFVGAGKFFGARNLGTMKRFFTSVGTDMGFQVIGPRERTFAMFALERFGAGVIPDMTLELICARELFIAALVIACMSTLLALDALFKLWVLGQRLKRLHSLKNFVEGGV